MRTKSSVERIAWVVAVLGCGPSADEGDAEESTTATSDSADETVTSVDATSAESSGAPGSSDGGTTGVIETCTPGTFEGLYSVGFESSGFQDCATGEDWWFAGSGGGNEGCPPEMWVRVEGEVCGPGHYGQLGAYDYELRGEIVLGPCEASCGEDPSDDACTSFDALCPFYYCDPVAQDCRRGQRCAPTSAEGTSPWTGAACVPIEEPAQPIGAPCDPGEQWGGNCEAAAFCVGEPEEICAPLCHIALDECDVGTCWPCDFGGDTIELGVCNETELAC